MQAFILGAGLGTRLAPLTHILPKPLMPVFQKPLIQHTMDHYIRCGVSEFMVNISCLPLMWERAFPEPTYRGCPVSFSEEENPMDSGGGVKKIMPWVKPGDVPFYGEGKGWQRQSHIYASPFYYIDYCLAQTVALRFWAMIRKDLSDAWAHYMAYTKEGGSKTFTDLLKHAGLDTPFDEACLRAVCEEANKWLSEFDLGGIV